jgi:hypothetical protein
LFSIDKSTGLTTIKSVAIEDSITLKGMALVKQDDLANLQVFKKLISIGF